MIVGIGTDIVEKVRVMHALLKNGFKQRVYTEYEINKGNRMNLSAADFWSGRWAAKEAFGKALGTGIGESCSLQDVEVRSRKNGAPYIEASGAAKKRMEDIGAKHIWVTISHERDYVVATVVLEGE